MRKAIRKVKDAPSGEAVAGIRQEQSKQESESCSKRGSCSKNPVGAKRAERRKLLQAGKLQQESSRSKASRKVESCSKRESYSRNSVGAKQAESGELLQEGKLQQESSRSKASRKGEIAPIGKSTAGIRQEQSKQKMESCYKYRSYGRSPQPEAVPEQNHHPQRKRHISHNSPLSGENLLYNMQKPHIIITKYAYKDLRDENNCIAI